MNLEKLKTEAIYLMQLLEKFSLDEPDAKLCLETLRPYINKAIEGDIKKPVKNIPCGYYFHEGTLRKYYELEEAYSNFTFRITGGNEEKLSSFINSLKNDKR